MKKAACFVFALLLNGALNHAAFAACTPGSTWTAVWTDSLNQTSYMLEAPCKVYIGIPFTITATVSDAAYPNVDVGFGWAIKDNGGIIAGGGFNWITTISGQWQKVIEQTYTGTPIDHLIEFKFSDLGAGSGAHFWASSLIGNITVDPYPPASNTPPAADAGPDIFLESKDLNLTTIHGSASDADGDSLSYRWLENSVELQASLPVDASGDAPLHLATIAPLSIGSHTLTLEVSDGTTAGTDTVVVAVENSLPIAAAAAGGTFQAGEDIRLNGTVADYDGDVVTYRWLEGVMILAQGTLSTPSGGAPAALPEFVIPGGLPLGSHNLVVEVNDGIHTATASAARINVIDTLAPTLAPRASTNILWPPNGEITEVRINANAHDNGNGPLLLSVMVTENLPSGNGKDKKDVPHYSVKTIDQAAGIIVLELRSAKGKGGDRVYEAALTVVDASGNSSSAVVAIKAIHDMGRSYSNGIGGARSSESKK